MGVAQDNIKDADNNLHPSSRNDVERAYLNIVISYNEKMIAKWGIETEIKGSSNIQQLESIDLSSIEAILS